MNERDTPALPFPLEGRRFPRPLNAPVLAVPELKAPVLAVPGGSERDTGTAYNPQLAHKAIQVPRLPCLECHRRKTSRAS